MNIYWNLLRFLLFFASIEFGLWQKNLFAGLFMFSILNLWVGQMDFK